MKATPRKNKQVGALADMIRYADEFARKPFGYNNPPVAAISDLLGIPAVQRTLERVSYGEPLTTGKGQTTRMRSDTEEALLAATQFVPPLKQLALVTKDMPVGAVIKNKGGNWLEGSVESNLAGLKRGWPYETYGRLPPEIQREIDAETGIEVLAKRFPKEWHAAQDPLDAWIDKQLTRYVKNEMATPEDPVRALAERGVLHYEPRPRNLVHPSGEVLPQMGQSEAAKGWENLSDRAVAYSPMRDYQDFGHSNITRDQPWVAKLDPETPMYRYNTGVSNQDLGFPHLIDEIRNSLNPNSGLPANLLLKPESLSKVTVPQAVERVAKINEWRAAQKAEADLARANNAATALHKEYPEQGFRWVELRHPEGAPKPGFGVAPADDPLTQALKYEGDVMGHCVGGYCPDVLEGRSRIFSLRDKKGQPHVTIEVEPGRLSGKNSLDEWKARFAETHGPEAVDPFLAEHPEIAQAFVPTIKQIKGKANRAPNPEYLPYVQDFVRSGKWSEVGDLGNTGLIGIAPDSDIASKFKGLGKDAPRYVTQDELTGLGRWLRGEIDSPDEALGLKLKPGYADGGLVSNQDTGYNPLHVDYLVDSLREELFQ
jgi:hypothetical protein